MHTLILAHGERPTYELIERMRAVSDSLLATDGAANDLVSMGITPDVVIGDLDSLNPAAREDLEGRIIERGDQDSSDLEKAVAYALEQGAKRITILGATGGRIDHTLANLSLLLRYGSDAEIRIVDERSEVICVTDFAEIHGRPGDTLSVIPFAEAGGVTLEGTMWPLRDETLLPGTRGVSNVLVSPTARITVNDGAVLVCHLRVGDE